MLLWNQITFLQVDKLQVAKVFIWLASGLWFVPAAMHLEKISDSASDFWISLSFNDHELF